jgi:hypothetical protein
MVSGKTKKQKKTLSIVSISLTLRDGQAPAAQSIDRVLFLPTLSSILGQGPFHGAFQMTVEPDLIS